MNQSARDLLALARELGGQTFVDWVLANAQSEEMADRVMPEIVRQAFTPEQARLVDRAFLIGLWQGWHRATYGQVDP